MMDLRGVVVKQLFYSFFFNSYNSCTLLIDSWFYRICGIDNFSMVLALAIPSSSAMLKLIYENNR